MLVVALVVPASEKLGKPLDAAMCRPKSDTSTIHLASNVHKCCPLAWHGHPATFKSTLTPNFDENNACSAKCFFV